MATEREYIKGRGAQLNPFNPFRKSEFTEAHIEAIDEQYEPSAKTKFFTETPKEFVNKVTSPDVGMMYSANPYQGCEHGCIYCYARNSHQYWGFSAGLDFEQKIIVKPDAPRLLEETLLSKSWRGETISFSGNTDCYQPIERKMQLTRKCLEVMLRYRNPVGIISKNQLMLRDIDILQELAKMNLIHVMLSVTTLNEDLRLKMEPRTATGKNRLKVVEQLSKAGVPVGVMIAPIVPGLNSSEVPEILKQASEHGAYDASFTVVRLNGAIGGIFSNWVKKAFPDAAQKILNDIAACHLGGLNDSRWSTRMVGDGPMATAIHDLFRIAKKKYFPNAGFPPYNYELFSRAAGKGQLSIF